MTASHSDTSLNQRCPSIRDPKERKRTGKVPFLSGSTAQGFGHPRQFLLSIYYVPGPGEPRGGGRAPVLGELTWQWKRQGTPEGGDGGDGPGNRSGAGSGCSRGQAGSCSSGISAELRGMRGGLRRGSWPPEGTAVPRHREGGPGASQRGTALEVRRPPRGRSLGHLEGHLVPCAEGSLSQLLQVF